MTASYGCCLPSIHPADQSHEEHMDAMDKARSRRELAAGNWRGYAVLEIARLREKAHLMTSGRWPDKGEVTA